MLFVEGLLNPSPAAAEFKTLNLHSELLGYPEILNEIGTGDEIFMASSSFYVFINIQKLSKVCSRLR